MTVLVIDVGGTHVKVRVGGRQPVKIRSGPNMTARQMAREVRAAVNGSPYDVVSIGYPGAARRECPSAGGCRLGLLKRSACKHRIEHRQHNGRPMRRPLARR